METNEGDHTDLEQERELIVARLNYKFLNDQHSPKLSDWRPNYFDCKNLLICRTAHENSGQQLDIKEAGMLECLVSEENWNPLYCYLLTFLSPKVYFNKELFRSLLYTIIAITDETLHNKYIDILIRHLQFHPPCNSKMKNYYFSIMTEKMSSVHIVDDYLKHSLLNVFESIQNKMDFIKQNFYEDESQSSTLSDETQSLVQNYSQQNFQKWLHDFNTSVKNPQGNSEAVYKQIKIFEKLFLILELLVDILDQDLFIFLGSFRKNYSDALKSQLHNPLISKIVWKANKTRGHVNKHCKYIFDFLCPTPQKLRKNVYRYIGLLAEIARISDSNAEKNYPFYGRLCKNFARELAISIRKGVQNKNTQDEINDLIEPICPMWLKMYVANEFLNYEVSSPEPEITLKGIVFILYRNLRKTNCFQCTDGKKISGNPTNAQELHDGSTCLIEYIKKRNFIKVMKAVEDGAAVTIWNRNDEGQCAIDLLKNDPDHREDLQAEFFKAAESYTCLNLSEDKLRLLYFMLCCYIRIYHIYDFYPNDLPREIDPVYHYNYPQHVLDRTFFNSLYDTIKRLMLYHPNNKYLKYIYILLNNRIE